METEIHFPEPQRPKRALISLTPLIDVVFILLVFFMLVSSFVHQAALPLATPIESQATGPVDDPPLVIVLREAGRVEFAGATVALDALGDALRQPLEQHSTRTITLRVQPSLPIQATVEALDVLRAAEPDALNVRRLEE